MSRFPTAVVHEVSGADNHLIYAALDKWAATQPDGPTRDRLDRLLAQVADNTRLAFLAECAENRGAEFLAAIAGTPDADTVADAADPGRAV